MHHDTDGGNRLGSAHGTARLSAAAAIAGLASLALLAPACGGASKSPGVASAGGTTSITVATSGSSGSSAPAGSDSSGESSQPRQLQFAHCMRSHGVPDFPDPGLAAASSMPSPPQASTRSRPRTMAHCGRVRSTPRPGR